jgi:FdhD protein
MKDSVSTSVRHIAVEKINGDSCLSTSDVLSVEEPLEIRICYGRAEHRAQKSISVTMRTPGHDPELAIGFLFTEGIISSYHDIDSFHFPAMECSSQKDNIIQMELVEGAEPRLQQADRNFYTTSSCGVCGKGSIQSIRTVNRFQNLPQSPLHLHPELFYQLPGKLKQAQRGFATTGGIHASGLFSIKGDLVLLREDVGRHNALDKLIGAALSNHSLPLRNHILLLSGRASFELIQKAAMAGILVVAAIGAPSSLAVELAAEFDITLLGFLNEKRFNIYNCSQRILIPSTADYGR